MADEDKLFDVKGSAAYLGGVSPYTVHAWLSEGRLRRVKIGSRTMIKRSELDRLIAEGDGQKDKGRPRPEQQAQGEAQSR